MYRKIGIFLLMIPVLLVAAGSPSLTVVAGVLELETTSMKAFDSACLVMELQDDPDARVKLAKAKEYFDDMNLDQAIGLLTEIVNMNASKEILKDVYLLLGHAYLAKGMLDKTTWALNALADIYPPRIELDPVYYPPQLLSMYYSVCKEKTGSYAVERDPGLKTLAVLEFRNRLFGSESEKYNGLQYGFADLMINQLSGTVDLKVVERERLAWMLQELDMNSDPSKVDQSIAVKAGKLLGVQTILFGSYVGSENNMKLTARMVNVETGEIIGTEEVPGEMDDFFELVDKLAIKIAKKINVKVSEADFKERTETKSLDAMVKFSDGEALYTKGDYKGAFDKFQEALQLDPAFSRAKVRLDGIKSLIG